MNLRPGGSSLLLLLAATPLSAQQPPVHRELGIIGLTTLSDPALIGGGIYAAFRPGGNARIAATAVIGAADGSTVGRGELLAHFVLNPRRMQGLGVYGLGGIAGVAGRGTTRGYLVLGAGIESASGRRHGWAVEGGVGGGVRLTAGWRWRW